MGAQDANKTAVIATCRASFPTNILLARRTVTQGPTVFLPDSGVAPVVRLPQKESR